MIDREIDNQIDGEIDGEIDSEIDSEINRQCLCIRIGAKVGDSIIIWLEVETGGKTNVALDHAGGLFHFAKQDGISHDSGGPAEFSTALVQPHDASHNGSLQHFCQLHDGCKGSAARPLVDHLN